MTVPNVLALPLNEAVRRVEDAGFSYEIEVLLPPRDNEESFADKDVRKYVVRQKLLSDDKLVLTVVYRQ